ncbi:variant surface glycoprotein (VSG, atypical), putative [Trypanosoma brucei brucei TREU927]|uniref:Variant surface glycoprotein (VSG, atypical), putative n=1 Tax=Trypanosoma brucei brucei (strain 927/4 GUTat10.1) TaxID=185431 RepID=Q38CU3_TRYB2|nr:variant surface glycoprotein [Trypanosoma brucei brucei TREU927]EAN77377.1 variant surface glycoprotein (VSG, atypical), putative [Trypanosoma brucei brucei TREU927]
MQGTMYWVVFLVAALQGIHLVLGQEEILNEQEFEALCRMINWAERGLKHINLARQVTEEALKIGVRYLEVAGEEEVTELTELQEKACMSNKKTSHEKNCGLYKTFWEESQEALKRTARSQAPHRGRNSLQYHTAEGIKIKVMEVADTYHEVKKEILKLRTDNMEEQLNQALYGVGHFTGEVKGGDSDRSRVCGQNLGNRDATGGWSLAVDLLCLCARHISWSSVKSVCCEECGTGENSNTWNPALDGALHWEFLKENCPGDNTNHHTEGEQLKSAKKNFMAKVSKIATIPYRTMYKLGDSKNIQTKQCGANIGTGQGICVYYGSDNGANLHWMQALERVENDVEVLLQDSKYKSTKLKRIKELSQEIQNLIEGGTPRGRQKRSVDTENSVPETPADPSDPTQSTTHTNEKKRIVRKPISTGNNASKSYGGDEVDSYDSKCDGENSACSDSPAKPTVKSSKSAINCPLGLILLLV